MINHIVLMKMNGGADAAVMAKIQDYADQIRDRVGEVRSYEIVPNVAEGNKGYNWAILSVFDSEADIETYKVTPLHRAFVAFCDPYTEDFLTLDYGAEGA